MTHASQFTVTELFRRTADGSLVQEVRGGDSSGRGLTETEAPVGCPQRSCRGPRGGPLLEGPARCPVNG